MRPFCCTLLLSIASLLSATAATASPLFGALERASDRELQVALAQSVGSTDYFPISGAIATPDLPLPTHSDLDSRAVFRALLLGHDLRNERAVLGDLVGALPRLREERRLEIRELRGDARDPSDPTASLGGARIGMR